MDEQTQPTEPSAEDQAKISARQEREKEIKRDQATTGKKQKKKRKTPLEALKKPSWYKMVSFFDGNAKSVMKINDENVVLAGWIPPDMDCAVCLVPTSVTHEQGLALQKILEAQFRKPVLVLTNNTQLVKLKPISKGVADKYMESVINGEVVQVEANAERSEEAETGEAVASEG